MSFLTRLIDRIDSRIDRPADQSVLDDSGGGSERMVEADSPRGERAGKDIRRARGRRTPRWLFFDR